MNKVLLSAFVMLGVLMLGVPAGISAKGKPTPTPSPTSFPTPPKDCTQVFTPAMDPETGVCEEFSTPCDVPEGWVLVPTCGF